MSPRTWATWTDPQEGQSRRVALLRVCATSRRSSTSSRMLAGIASPSRRAAPPSGRLILPRPEQYGQRRLRTSPDTGPQRGCTGRRIRARRERVRKGIRPRGPERLKRIRDECAEDHGAHRSEAHARPLTVWRPEPGRTSGSDPRHSSRCPSGGRAPTAPAPARSPGGTSSTRGRTTKNPAP